VQPTDFKVLSFDCYGTLIDRETGILVPLRALVSRAGVALDNDGARPDGGATVPPQAGVRYDFRFNGLAELAESAL
jgi:hypothetical protein